MYDLTMPPIAKVIRSQLHVNEIWSTVEMVGGGEPQIASSKL
jgi:hypothetical protein